MLIELKRCTSCGFFLPEDEFHADNFYREDLKDVWCKGCKHNSKLQGRLLGPQGKIKTHESVVHIEVPGEINDLAS